mgnify:FL=1
MHERNRGADSASANLLVASERHLPGREAEKYYSVRFQVILAPEEKRFFSIRFDMLDDIVNQYDVEPAVLGEWVVCQEIGTGKLALYIARSEKFSRIFDFARSQVQSGHRAARFRERKQVSAFAAAYFQNPGVAVNVFEPLEIVDIELAGSACKFIEISFSVCLVCIVLRIIRLS